MTLTRRKLIQGTAIAVATTAAPLKLAFGQSAEFTYKFANNVPAAHPLNVRAKASARRPTAASTSRSFRATSWVPTRTP